MKTAAFTKTYNGRRVLNMPEFEFEKGLIYALIGPNGSGKSTLAKVYAGVERGDGGIAPLPCPSVGYMPQKSYAFRMSLKANLLLGKNDPARAERLMASLQILHLRDKPAHKLSGGETARMALGRLLMREYDFLILDEPTAAMDMESTAFTERLLCDYCRETGCTMLLITHSLQQARRIADEALVFHAGELVESGKKELVLYEPKEALTKKFLDFYGV